MHNKILDFKPKYSIICLIYKSNEWLDFVYNQVLKHTDLSETEFFFVANNAENEVKEYLKNNYIPHYNYESKEEQKNDWYINNVYRGYNYGAEKAKGDFLIFINSDMAFSKDWLPNLINKYNGSNCIASRLIESGRFLSGKYGLEKDFGTEFFNYKEKDFLAFSELYKEEGINKGGLYMPLFIKKEDFFDVGGYPEGNILEGSDLYNPTIAQKGDKISFTGDQALIEKLNRKGVEHVTSFDSIVYHFQAGELSYNKLNSITNKTNICIYNDLVTGTMGEKVLWDYLLEKLPGNVYGIDKRVVNGKGNFEENANNYLLLNYPNTDIIIQNATFISKMNNSIPTICYLQDDIRKMGQNTLLQEENLRKSDLIITNSIYTQNSYQEYSSEIIPIGINENLFINLNKEKLRVKYNIPNGIVGIFVGSLSETKGWNEIKEIIQTNKKVNHWIVISKYNEEITLENISFFKQVSQEVLAELLNCADFFILGSKVETQCLAALEAALCNIPVVMRNIGIFKQFTNDEKRKIGEFSDDFNNSINNIINNKLQYSPRNLILSKQLNINGMIEKWIEVISRFIMLNKSKAYKGVEKPIIKNSFLQKTEIFIRKKFLSKFGLGNFSFKRLYNFNFYKQLIYRILVKLKLYK